MILKNMVIFKVLYFLDSFLTLIILPRFLRNRVILKNKSLIWSCSFFILTYGNEWSNSTCPRRHTKPKLSNSICKKQHCRAWPHNKVGCEVLPATMDRFLLPLNYYLSIINFFVVSGLGLLIGLKKAKDKQKYQKTD